MIIDNGSFRDPAGRVYYEKNKVLRKLYPLGVERYIKLEEKNIITKSIEKGFLIKTTREKSSNDNEIILEHEKIPFVSYPYEWSFSQLKEAAIFHLDFNLFLLDQNATLIDSSAYNIQFIGSKPIFIDVLSLKEYEEGKAWLGHKQFCENFLNPLILKSKKGVKFNNWFKGNLEGIETGELDKLLNFFDKISYNIFVHVYLLNKFDQKFKSKKSLKPISNKKSLSKKGLIAIINQLKNFIINLKDYKTETTWDSYSQDNSYTSNEENEKKKIVKNFIHKNNFNMLADLGCNDGEYSRLALENGSNSVIGFDFDINSIDRAFKISKNNNLNFLPLYFDATNPSCNLGWLEKERKGFNERVNFDGVIALAFEHHLAIAKNIPLDEVIKWIVSLAPKGLIEFVPKTDKTVIKMLELKGDIFPEYNEKNFENILRQNVDTFSKTNGRESGRIIYEFKR